VASCDGEDRDELTVQGWPVGHPITAEELQERQNNGTLFTAPRRDTPPPHLSNGKHRDELTVQGWPDTAGQNEIAP